MSPKKEHGLERLNFELQMAQFDPAKHLKERGDERNQRRIGKD